MLRGASEHFLFLDGLLTFCYDPLLKPHAQPVDCKSPLSIGFTRSDNIPTTVSDNLLSAFISLSSSDTPATVPDGGLVPVSFFCFNQITVSVPNLSVTVRCEAGQRQ
jgi:hypothetical protein